MPKTGAMAHGDPDAVARAQAGDVGAFEEVYRENVGRVYALCLRMTRDRSLAEELTQEAFVRAWRKLNSFRGDSAFSTWLHRLTANVVCSELRARGRRESRVTTTDDLERVDREGVRQAPGVRMDIEAAIGTLPEGARQVFLLYEVEGYRHDEIAELMGIAPGTSKAQLHRARTLLRGVLSI